MTAPESTVETPSQPLGVTVDKDTANQLTVKWNTPADDGGSAITNYKIEHKLSSQSGSVWTPYIISGSLREYTLSDLQATCHDIQISAGNSQGYSEPVLIECTEVNDPTPPATPSTPPVATPPTVKPPTLSSTPTSNTTPQAITTPTVSGSRTAPASNSEDTTTSNENTSGVAVGTTNNDTTTITWQIPSDMEPQHYIIEYRDASIPESDTTTPWKRISEVPGNHSSATITLPEGSYNVRVAAVLPGGKTTRVILGVARVSIPRYTNMAALKSGSSPATWPLWAVICMALFAITLLFLIPIIWKKRRKKAQASSIQLPPRHWS
jgi:hypothetical protein